MGKWTTIAEAAIELLSKKGGGALPDTTLPIRPARENLRTVVDSNTIGGRVSGDEMLPIDSLSGGPSLSARGQKAVDDIVEQMSGPDGFIERLIVDQDNNVIEGAHRVEALRRLGIEQVPITRVVDPTANLDLPKMGEAINAVGPIHSDHVNQITAQVGDMLAEVGGDPAKVLQEFDLPKGFERFFRAALDSVPPKTLPTDEASRMARAQEFPIESYHGTRSEFGDFGARGFGDHFGTPEQANMRLKNTRRERGDEGAERVLPVRLNIRSPLEMEDVGEWGSPAKVAEGLKKTPVGAKNSQALDEIIEEAEDLRPQFEDNDYFLASPEAEDLLDDMRRMVEAEGHDGIKYSNQVENTYGDRADLTPEAKKIKSGLEADLRKIQKTISDRDPAPPLGSDVATLQRWLDRPKIEPTTAEAAELERVNKALQYSNFETGDPNSYIVFDPSNVRSRFAQFDPAKAGSADILAGFGVVGAGAALSQQDGFDYGALSNVAEGSNGQSSN